MEGLCLGLLRYGALNSQPAYCKEETVDIFVEMMSIQGKCKAGDSIIALLATPVTYGSIHCII
jgi:hypothetical protein